MGNNFFKSCRWLVAVLFFLLGGCAGHEPVRHLTSDVSLIVLQQSTREDVLAYLGPPDTIRKVTDTQEVWYYYQSHKSTLRKTPYVGEHLGYEEYEFLEVVLQNGAVSKREYRLLTENQFRETGLVISEK